MTGTVCVFNYHEDDDDDDDDDDDYILLLYGLVYPLSLIFGRDCWHLFSSF